MSQRIYFLISGSVFLVLGVAHLTRLILGWEIAIAGWTVPQWISWPGVLFPGLVSGWGFALASRVRSA